ncbi:MAG: HypC/HybG/HupF family hydrogenase formation chaperone [Candidatus Glassbacteria bacterium]|nr:HypC/HybG/HupF family hydrogenase formation chaperone [Candidatus Glassbacteria bacterium]
MCLGIPGRVEKVEDNRAKVSFGEVSVAVSLDLLAEPVSAGDYVIVHAGFALERLDEEEAQRTLEMLREISELETR